MARGRSHGHPPRRPVSGEHRRRWPRSSAAEIDPERKPHVRRSIRDNVGNSRPATAPDPPLNHLVGDGQQGLTGKHF